jgi:cytochrome c
MKRLTAIIGLALLGSLLMSSQVGAADGSALFKAKGCAGCHGPTAMGAVGPRLAGIQAPYLFDQFKLIRDKKRTSGKSGMMAGAVKNVTNDEAKAITDYLGGLK